jgi:hypothetical protein
MESLWCRSHSDFHQRHDRESENVILVLHLWKLKMDGNIFLHLIWCVCRDTDDPARGRWTVLGKFGQWSDDWGA